MLGDEDAYKRARSIDLPMHTEEEVKRWTQTYVSDFTFTSHLLSQGERDENGDIWLDDHSYTHTVQEIKERNGFAHGFLSLLD